MVMIKSFQNTQLDVFEASYPQADQSAHINP